MIDAATLESDESGWILVLEDLNGTHLFPCDPALIEAALQPWRMHELEGELVRREFEASGRVSWDEYRAAQERTDPEWADGLAEAADLARKRDREMGHGPYVLTDVDPGDETDA